MNDKQISNAAKSALNKSTDSLNSETLHRLRQARESALLYKQKEHKTGGVSFLSWKWITGAGAGLAFASILTFMILPQLSQSSISPLDDLDLLTAEVDLDVVDHLDFYQWLDESLDES